MANTEPEGMIEVSESWMKQIADLAEKVSKQMKNLPDEDFTVLAKTDISALVGYAGSARNVLKYRRIARDQSS